MNKLKFLAIVLLTTAVSLTGCKKDDDNSVSIVGKWNFKKSVTKSTFGEFTITGKAGEYIEFKADGKGTSSIDGDIDTFSYTLDNKKLTIKDSDNETIVNTISKQTASELVFSGEETYSEGGQTLKSTTEVTLAK